MPVTIKDVEHVAALARLELSEAEKEKFTHQLNGILTYIEKLNELDTSKIEPLLHVVELSPALGGVMSEDVVKESFPREEMLKNAPDRTGKFFKVPKVIENR